MDIGVTESQMDLDTDSDCVIIDETEGTKTPRAGDA